MDDFKISPIRNGTAIDHIAVGQAINVLKILNVNEDTICSAISIGMHVKSKKNGGWKDIIKIEDRELDRRTMDKIALKDLEREVFGTGDHWDAIKEVLVNLYPGLWESLKLKYPEMDEMELRVCMLSRLKLSRLGEATLLGISTSVLDKLRTKVRKTMEQDNNL